MKTRLVSFLVCALAILLSASDAFALLPQLTDSSSWNSILGTLLYSGIGIVLAAIGYKVVDFVTPGNLSKQLTEEKNMALALVIGAMMLGVCVIIAASIAS